MNEDKWCSKCARRKARRIFHRIEGRHPNEEELDLFAAKYKTLFSNNDINDLIKIIDYFVIDALPINSSVMGKNQDGTLS